MRKILQRSVASIVLLTSPAMAADIGIKAPPPAPVPVYSWTGFYVGGHLGAGISRDDWSADQIDWFNVQLLGPFAGRVGPLTDAGSHNDVGLLGGFQVGYNWQFPSTPIVVGIEGEWSFADLQGNHSNTTPFAGSFFGGAGLFTGVGTEASRFSTKVEDIATIAGRFGVTSGPQDRTLWYVKGGAAWVRDSFAETTHVTGEFTEASPSPVIGQFNGSGSVRHDRWGWVVGTGVELGLIGNWSAKIEYEFLDLGTMNFTMPITGQLGANCAACFIPIPSSFNRNSSVKQEINVIKVGLNYRFWGY